MPDINDVSFDVVKRQIEDAVRSGTLTREKARETLEGARKNYRSRSISRMNDLVEKNKKRFYV